VRLACALEPGGDAGGAAIERGDGRGVVEPPRDAGERADRRPASTAAAADMALAHTAHSLARSSAWARPTTPR